MKLRSYITTILLIVSVGLAGCNEGVRMQSSASGFEAKIKSAISEFLRLNSDNQLLHNYNFHLDYSFASHTLRDEGGYWTLGAWTIVMIKDNDFIATQSTLVADKTMLLKVDLRLQDNVLRAREWGIEEQREL